MRLARLMVVLMLALSFTPQAHAELGFAEAASLVEDFYNIQGEWAGVFKMKKIENMVLKEDNRGYKAHVCYYYVPVRGNFQGRTDSGYDRRVFTIGAVRGEYRVLDMGGNKSGRVQCRD